MEFDAGIPITRAAAAAAAVAAAAAAAAGAVTEASSLSPSSLNEAFLNCFFAKFAS
uniref:Uncharacterized protein n=1 Tax=Fagus sylvatica TaxID=28930 RepID=A0A2N9GHA2_FAGSY